MFDSLKRINVASKAPQRYIIASALFPAGASMSVRFVWIDAKESLLNLSQKHQIIARSQQNGEIVNSYERFVVGRKA